jgi:hypothetical protein
LRWLAQQNDALINRAEITLDLTFKYRANVDEAWDFVHQHGVRRWHRKNQEIRAFRSPPRGDDPGTGETRYDAGGRAPNRLVLYAEDHTRITGELNCLHLEWRVNGLRAVRAVGIKSGQDLPEFDHRAFWQTRLLFYTVDRRRLGLQIRNRRMGTRRRSSRTYRSNADWMDSKTGEVRCCQNRGRNSARGVRDDTPQPPPFTLYVIYQVNTLTRCTALSDEIASNHLEPLFAEI